MKAGKERKSGVITWSTLSLMIFAALLTGFTAQSQAETLNYRISQYYVQLEALPVGDVEGHVISIFSRKGLASFENGEVATYTNWGTVDLIKGKGSVKGYAKLTYQDGSTNIAVFQGTTDAGAVKLTGEFIKGTGRLEGIKGTLSISGRSLTPYAKDKGMMGDGYYDVTATYTLPQR